MLSSPLRQHILDYKPPRGFVSPTLTIFDGFDDPDDHMLYYNQAMTLNFGNDRLLCKAFLASLGGPALAWFHKFPRYSINDKRETSTPYKLFSNRKKSLFETSQGGLGKSSSK